MTKPTKANRIFWKIIELNGNLWAKYRAYTSHLVEYPNAVADVKMLERYRKLVKRATEAVEKEDNAN